MKVPSKVIKKMIRENEHNKYTTTYLIQLIHFNRYYLFERKLERGELNLDKYDLKNDSEDEESSVISGGRGHNHSNGDRDSNSSEYDHSPKRKQHTKGRSLDRNKTAKHKQRHTSKENRPSIKQPASRGYSSKNSGRPRKRTAKNSASSMDVKRAPSQKLKSKKSIKSKKSKSRKTRKKSNTSQKNELPQINTNFNINDITLDLVSKVKPSSNKRPNTPSGANYQNFRQIFNSSRRDYTNVQKQIFSKSNGNKKKQAAMNRQYMYSTNSSHKKGNSMRGWKKDLYISTDGRKGGGKDNSQLTSPKNFAQGGGRRYPGSGKNKDTKSKDVLESMLKKMSKSRKSKGKTLKNLEFCLFVIFRLEVIGGFF